jgi:predicted nucleic acid-binding protein
MCRRRGSRTHSSAHGARRGPFFRHPYGDYSCTDCTSFGVMRELRLKQALTSDRHFRQMGFQALA